MLSSEDIHIVARNQGMISVAQKYTSKELELLNVPKTDTLEGMSILCGLFLCLFKYSYVILLAYVATLFNHFISM